MKKTLTLGLLTILSVTGAARAQQAREAVIAAENTFAAQAARDGSAAAFLANSTAASMVVENGQLANAQKVWQNKPQTAGNQRLVWHPVMADVAQSGELGYTTGPWTFGTNTQITAAGDYVTLWQKQSNGEWKFVVDMGVEHSDDAVTAPGTVARPQLFAGPATPVPVPAHAIIDLDNTFAKAELHKPLETYQAYLSKEARLLRPGQLALLGPTAQVVISNTLSRAYLFAPTGGYLAASGDLGYVYGTLRRPSTDPRQPEETGSYLRIWRREAVAGWRIVLEVLNEATSAPAVAATPAAPAPASAAPATATTPASPPADGAAPVRQ
jgi:ketosteroid isomerase-like protein